MHLQFVPDCVDFGTAQEVRVSGLASMYRPSPGIVQFGFYTRCPISGGYENRYSLYLVQDFSEWLHERALWRNVLENVKTSARMGCH